MRIKFVLLLAVICSAASPVCAASSVSLDFSGSGNTLAATGFDGVYNINPATFSVTGGSLDITTVPSDTYGQYEGDPDDAVNMFYSYIDPQASTTVDAKMTISNLNVNFHGGGIWMGTDNDHYIRLGACHNSYEGGVIMEVIRENEDLWTAHGGPGGDIIAGPRPVIGQPLTSIDVYLRLVRTGSDATAWYSLNGVDYLQLGGVFDSIATAKTSEWIEDDFKFGVFAFGGPFGSNPATASFDYLNATSVPEPGTLVTLLAGSAGLIGIYRRRR